MYRFFKRFFDVVCALIGIIGPRPVAQDQFEMFRYGKWNEAARNAPGFSASSWMTPA